MDKTDTITIYTDSDTKKSVESLSAEIGLSVSDAVNMFFRKSIQEHDIPIWEYEYRYNQETIDAIEESEEILRNPHLNKSYSSFKELLEDLESDDDDDEV